MGKMWAERHTAGGVTATNDCGSTYREVVPRYKKSHPRSPTSQTRMSVGSRQAHGRRECTVTRAQEKRFKFRHNSLISLLRVWLGGTKCDLFFLGGDM